MAEYSLSSTRRRPRNVDVDELSEERQVRPRRDVSDQSTEDNDDDETSEGKSPLESFENDGEDDDETEEAKEERRREAREMAGRNERRAATTLVYLENTRRFAPVAANAANGRQRFDEYAVYFDPSVLRRALAADRLSQMPVEDRFGVMDALPMFMRIADVEQLHSIEEKESKSWRSSTPLSRTTPLMEPVRVEYTYNPSLKTGLLTLWDGNHRVQRLKKLGVPIVPVILVVNVRDYFGKESGEMDEVDDHLMATSRLWPSPTTFDALVQQDRYSLPSAALLPVDINLPTVEPPRRLASTASAPKARPI